MTDRVMPASAPSERMLLRSLVVVLLLITAVPAVLGWRLIAAYAALPEFPAAIERTINLSSATISPPASGEGIAVAPDGAIFVADLSGGRLLAFPDGTEASGSVLSDGVGGQVLRGFGLALSPDGTIYFLDNPTGLVHIFTRTGELLGSLPLGSPGARSIAVDDIGNIYVGDTGAQVVRKYLAGGKSDRSWGDDSSPGSVRLGGNCATGLAASRGNLYVACPYALLVLDEHGKLLTSRATPGPTGMLAAGSNGTIYASDIVTNRVWVYSQDARVLGRIVAADRGADIFGQPRGLALTREGRLYVVNDNRITVYSFQVPGKRS